VSSKREEVQETKKKEKEDLGTWVGERPARAACSIYEGGMLMMMIAFITFTSVLVPLIESLCSSNPCEFKFSGFRI